MDKDILTIYLIFWLMIVLYIDYVPTILINDCPVSKTDCMNKV